MKMCGVDVKTHVFLIWALDGSEWSASHSGRFTLGGRSPGRHSIGDYLDPRNDAEKKNLLTLQGFELLPLCPSVKGEIILTTFTVNPMLLEHGHTKFQTKFFPLNGNYFLVFLHKPSATKRLYFKSSARRNLMNCIPGNFNVLVVFG
jgi:hypothetical protein